METMPPRKSVLDDFARARGADSHEQGTFPAEPAPPRDYRSAKTLAFRILLGIAIAAAVGACAIVGRTACDDSISDAIGLLSFISSVCIGVAGGLRIGGIVGVVVGLLLALTTAAVLWITVFSIAWTVPCS
jgi:hypothetical protein